MKNVMLITILVLVVATTVGLAIGANNVQNSLEAPDLVSVQSGFAEVEKEVYLTNMAPAESATVTLRLQGKQNRTYAFTCSFQAGEHMELAEYVSVKLMCGDVLLGEAPLAELVNGMTIAASAAFADGDTESIRIIYTMGEHVGNEAQGKRADLTITLTAEEQ